jgi:formylglycine-generating enzyme required for sulfatase activity
LNGSGAQIIVNGGDFLINGRFNVGQGSDGYITMNGGTFTVTGTFKFPDDDGGVHRMYLNDGIMHSGDIQLYWNRDAIIYVAAGILRLDDVTPGSDEYDPAEWVEQEALLSADGYDAIVIEYVPAGPYTEVRAVRWDPNIVWRPRPVDYAPDVAVDANLTWSPGDSAVLHDVYFGTNFGDVNTASDPNTLPGRGRQGPNSYDPLGLLELGKPYYWRIDEFDGGKWRGPVWRFTVEDGKARDENPTDAAVAVPADANLSWTPGALAVRHDIYIGTDFNDVNGASDPNTPPGRGRLDVNSFDPPVNLGLFKTYYWRVDEVGESTFVKGDVWRFTVAPPYVNLLGMEFTYIPAGTFAMGSRNSDFDEEPVHDVTISQPFYMSRCEVTNAQYEQFDPGHDSIDHRGFSHEANEAVIFVSWEDANAFCDWLSALEGKAYRLPTEAEWEYACRAGTSTEYYTGETLPTEYHKNQVETTGPNPVALHVGETTANPWALYDMHGNVEEWCYDWYGPYEANEQTDPVGRVDGRFRVCRGGSHSTTVDYLRSVNRMGMLPEDNHWLIGFRVVIAALPATEPLPEPPPELYQTDVNQSVPPDINEGPDANVPYFDGPRTYVKIPPDSEGPLFSEHNHDPALTECPNGDLLAIWYTCIREKGRELAIAASRLRYGEDEWEEASAFWDGPDRNDHAPAMWTDETGKMYHFNGLGEAATWGALATILRTSTDNGVTWSAARLIIAEHDLRHMPVESVFRTSGGDIILPCDAALSSDPGGTAIWISEDEGQTWYDPGGTIAGIHAGVVEVSGGRLLAFGRGDNIDGKMPKSISTDMGQTWTYSASEFPPISGGQRLILRRLREGPILFVSFTDSDDGMMIPDVYGNERQVYGMFAAVSYDEGETWPVKRLVTAGGPAQELDGGGNTGWFVMDDTHAEHRGYLAATQTPDGVIQLISSAQHYRFNLAWIVEKHFITFDDMESYNDTDNLISETWIDGSANLTGSLLELVVEPNYPVHGGQKSMRYYYDNNRPPDGPTIFAKYSEIERTLSDPCDFTVEGVKALGFYFYGDGNNDANETEQMYLGLEDSDGNYAEVRYGDGEGEDINDIEKDEWQQWDIDLEDFNDGGVDLRDVNKVYIGFGDRDNPIPGGSGVVCFDDIRLYEPRCLAEYDVAADFTGNCVVDFEDVELLAGDWLKREGIVEGVNPDPNDLLLWYEFDESGGYSAADSSDHDYHGTVDGPQSGWDPCEGYYKGCRIFSDDTAVEVPTQALSDVNEGITFCVWLKDAWRTDSDNVAFETGSNDFVLRADVPDTGGNVFWQAGNDTNDQLTWIGSAPSEWMDSWSHYAFVKDANEGKMMIYHNGSLVAEKEDASHSLAGVHGAAFDIGALIEHQSDFIGRMDDFRVYDYALSQAEVVGAATNGGDLFVPLPRPAIDLYEDGKVSFMDYSFLADDWLEEAMWPRE